jgi:hypothetical protein
VFEYITTLALGLTLLNNTIEAQADNLGPNSSPASRSMLAPTLRTAVLRSAPRFVSPLTVRTPFLRTMASSSAPLQEWLVIIPDHEGALQKRIGVREQHLAGLKKDDEKFWLWGGMSSS